MLRAASMARRTSSRSMSRARLPSVTPPREFSPRTWLPATPIKADSTGTPETPSASSTARRMELTVASRFTMEPLRRPLDSAAPSARNFTCSSASSAISTQVLVLPMSNPTRYLSFFDKSQLLKANYKMLLTRAPAARTGNVRIQYRRPITHINRLHAAVFRLPDRKILHHRAVTRGEVGLVKTQRERLTGFGAGNARHHHPQFL